MSGVSCKGAGLSKIFKAVATLSKTKVLVGIPHGELHQNSSLTNAQIGYLLEKGSPARNLPARPHLLPGVAAVQDGIGVQLSKAVDAALDGNPKKMYFYLGTAGMKATMSVKNLINQGDFAPLAIATIRARQNRGHKSEKPLVETAQMRNAHTYVIMVANLEINRGNT